MLGEVEQKVIACFHNGGGLAYSEYPRFHALMAETSGEVFDASLVDTILLIPTKELPERLRTGADAGQLRMRQWACGERDGASVPRQPLTGIDFSEEGLAVGAGRGTDRWA